MSETVLEAAAALAALPADAPLIDALRLLHLAAVALGLGAVAATDLAMLRRFGAPLGPLQRDTIEGAHRLIAPALALAWASGLALAAWRTGLAAEAVTPKLAAKLAVVAALTANALLIARGVRPVLAARQGWRLVDLPLGQKAVLGLAGALSAAGWAAALLLGGSALLAAADWALLLVLLGALYGGALTLAALAVVLAHLRPRGRAVRAAGVAAE